MSEASAAGSVSPMRKIGLTLLALIVLPCAFLAICAMMTRDIVAAQFRRARG